MPELMVQMLAAPPAPPEVIAYLPRVDALLPAECGMGFTHRAALFVQFHSGTPERRVHRLGASDWDAVDDLLRILRERDCRVPDREEAVKAVEALLKTLVRPKPIKSVVASAPIRKTRKVRS